MSPRRHPHRPANTRPTPLDYAAAVVIGILFAVLAAAFV